MSRDRPPSAAAALLAAVPLTAAVAVPLCFVIVTEQVFEPAKAGLARALAAVALAAAVAGGVRRPGQPRDGAWSRSPLLWALVAVWLAETVAALGSVAPWPSVMGAYTRGQGWLTGTAVLVLGLAAGVTAGRPGGLGRIGTAIGCGVLPAGLYGVAQSFGLDPLPWSGDVVTRVVGPAGASVLLGAQLVIALPFAAWRAAAAWQAARRAGGAGAAVRLAAWLSACGVGLWALALTGARGPLIGLAAAATVAGLAAAARAGRGRAALAVAAAAAGLVAAVVALNVAAARGDWPTGAVSAVPVVDRLAHALDPDNSTTRVRLRLWEGTVAALAATPRRWPTGHGPETMDLVWAPHYPPILAYDEPRGWVPDRAHTWALDTLLTTGVLGLAAGLALWATLVDACLTVLGVVGGRTDRRRWLGAAAAMAVAAVIAARGFDGGWRLASPALGLGSVAGLGLALVGLARRRGICDDGHEAGRGGVGARPVRAVDPCAGFALAALAAVVAHAVEVQVGFEVTTTRLFVALIAGALVGDRCRRPVRSDSVRAGVARAGAAAPLTPGDGLRRPAPPDRVGSRWRPDGAWLAALTGVTLTFGFARFGLVGGGAPVAAALVAVPALLALALLAGPPTDAPPVASDGGGIPPTPWRSARRAVMDAAPPVAAVGAHAAVHVVLLTAGTAGTADAGRAVAGTTAWYGITVLGLLVAHARAVAGSGDPAPAGPAVVDNTDAAPTGHAPPGTTAAAPGLARRAAALGAAAAAAAGVWLGPTCADAVYKEGARAWQADVAGLQADGLSGKAESFLARAMARYANAARLAPWEPAYRLAVARAEVEWGDLLDARLSRALAAAGDAGAPDEYAPGLLGGDAARQVGARDARFAAALRAIDAADGLVHGRGPTAALARARALRVWGDRTRRPDLRTRRLADARAAYAVAIARAPGWPEVLDEAAGVALLMDDPRAALALTARAVALDRYYVRAWRTAAAAHAHLGDPAAAAGAYRRYFEDYRNTSDLPALRAWVAALVAAGRASEALPVARSIVRLAPGDAHAHADVAVLLEATGDPAGALAAARRAAALDPSDAGIAALARGLAARGRGDR